MTWGVIGHDWAVALLERGLAKGRIAHAYLFSGPPQIGKTRLARILAQAIWRIHTQRSVGWIFQTLRENGELPPIQQ